MTKQGRKPLPESTKLTEAQLAEDIFGDATKLDPPLQAELKEQGLVGRFVDAKQLYQMNGYHKNGWMPYKRKAAGTMGLSDFKYGTDPDGIVRRGSLILAVKTADAHRKHKLLLEHRAARYKAVQKNEADAMRAFQQDRQIDSQVVEGYDENEK